MSKSFKIVTVCFSICFIFFCFFIDSFASDFGSNINVMPFSSFIPFDYVEISKTDFDGTSTSLYVGNPFIFSSVETSNNTVSDYSNSFYGECSLVSANSLNYSDCRFVLGSSCSVFNVVFYCDNFLVSIDDVKDFVDSLSFYVTPSTQAVGYRLDYTVDVSYVMFAGSTNYYMDEGAYSGSLVTRLSKSFSSGSLSTANDNQVSLLQQSYFTGLSHGFSYNVYDGDELVDRLYNDIEQSYRLQNLCINLRVSLPQDDTYVDTLHLVSSVRQFDSSWSFTVSELAGIPTNAQPALIDDNPVALGFQFALSPIVNATSSFFDTNFFGFWSFGDFGLLIISVGLLVFFLKMFGGG